MSWCVRWSFATILLLGVMGLAAWFVFNQAVRGGGFVVVPDVTGWPVMQAANRLAEEGLEVGEQRPVMNDRMPEYHVLVQRPTPGKVIRKGREIALTISAGKQDMPAPKLLGRDIESAVQDLDSTPFMLGATARVPSELPAGTVLAQDPPADRPAKVGTEIHLLVSDGPAAGDLRMPNLVNSSIQNAIEELEAMNVSVETLVVEDDNAAYDTVLAQTPQPGSTLLEGESAKLEVRPLRAAALPSPSYKVDVVYEVPYASFSPRVRVDLVTAGGQRYVLFPKDSQRIDGMEPRLQPGTRMTIPDVVLADGARVEFYADDVLHKRYEYNGSTQPVVRTINEPTRTQETVASTPLPPVQAAPRPTVSTVPLPPATSPPSTPPPAATRENRPIEIEVFEPRTERVGPAP